MKDIFGKLSGKNDVHKRKKQSSSVYDTTRRKKLSDLEDVDEDTLEDKYPYHGDTEFLTDIAQELNNRELYGYAPDEEAYDEDAYDEEETYQNREYEDGDFDDDYIEDEASDDFYEEDADEYALEDDVVDEGYDPEEERISASKEEAYEEADTYEEEDEAYDSEDAYLADEAQDDDMQIVDLDITQNIQLLDDDLPEEAYEDAEAGVYVDDAEEYSEDEAYAEDDVYETEDEYGDDYIEYEEYAAAEDYANDEDEDYAETDEYVETDDYTEEDDYVDDDDDAYAEADEHVDEEDAYYEDEAEADETAVYDNEFYDDEGYENEYDAYESIDDSYNDGDASYYSEEEGDEEENLYYFGQHKRTRDDADGHFQRSRKSETVASIFGMTSGVFGGRKGGKKSSHSDDEGENKIIHFFKHMSVMDGILMATGVGVLLIAIVTGSMWVSAKEAQKQIAAIAPIGQQLSSVGVIGESGLLALNDARLSAANAEPVTEEMETETEEAEVGNDVSVSFTSMEKDLKIKFTYKETDKLVTGTEFEVVLTNSKGKETTLKDSDMDGVIYESNMAAGTYDVIIKSIGDFQFPETAQKVTVKDKIEYVVVNVRDEIKSEAEVNVAVEDTAQQNVVQETPTVADTVEWVESTKTKIDNGDGYEKINKDTITDPSTLTRLMTTRLLDTLNVKLNQDQASLTVGESTELKGNKSDYADVSSDKEKVTYTDNWSSSDSSVASVDNGKVTAQKAGTATITYKITKKTVPIETKTEEVTEEISVDAYNKLSSEEQKKCEAITQTVEEPVTEPSTEEGETTTDAVEKVEKITGYRYKHTVDKGTQEGAEQITEATATCTVTVKAAEATISSAALSLNKSDETISVGGTVTIAPSKVEYKKSDGSTESRTDSFPSITWTSSDSAIATVDASGVVKGVKTGSVTITAKATGIKDGSGKELDVKATCKVTVNAAAELTLTLDQEKATVAIGKEITIKPTVTNAVSDSSVTWESADKAIATVDNKGVVKGIKAGTVKITATTVEKKASTGEKLTATCTITVGTKAQLDTETLLKDNAGRQVYIKVDGKYVNAVYADYYTAEKFYILNESYKYTGWQTIDNKTYFYDKNGKVVTGTQIIQGVEYTFNSEGVLKMNSNGGALGIDVSKWNGSINWTAVKNSGVDFVIIRCGYRGSSTGALIQDPTFVTNIKGAKNAGLKVGVYFFTQAINEAEAVEEASMAVALSKSYGLTYPIFIDTEGSGGRADGLSKSARTAVVSAFCQTVANSGCKAGVYASKSWFESKLSASAISSYKIWLAQYATKPTYGGRYDMWQYSSKGTVGGINGRVDMNISYLGY